MKKYNIEGINIVRLEGNPYERWLQNGTLSKKEITNAVQITYNDLLKDPKKYTFFIEKSKVLEKGLSEDFKSELLWISHGADIKYENILMHNLIFTIEMKFACFAWSCINTKNKLLTLRQLDLNINSDSYKEMILYIVKPEKWYSFFTLAIPGFIDSETGMNEKGITISQNNIYIKQTHWNIKTIWELTRKLLQFSKSIDEINNYLDNEEEYPARLLLCSSPDTASVFEIANTNKAKIDLINNKICVTNHPRKIKNTISSTDSSYKRLDYANIFFEKNIKSINFEKVLKLLRSPLISRKISKTTTNWQSVIFSPSTLNFWIAKPNKNSNKSVCLNEYIEFNLIDLLYDENYKVGSKDILK